MKKHREDEHVMGKKAFCKQALYYSFQVQTQIPVLFTYMYICESITNK